MHLHLHHKVSLLCCDLDLLYSMSRTVIITSLGKTDFTFFG